METKLEGLINAFLTYHKVEGSTDKTVTWHSTSLRKLREYLSEQGIEDAAAVNRETLRNYVAYLQTEPGSRGTPLSPHSISTYVRSVRAFFSWLAEEEYIDANPALRVSEPRAPEREVEILSGEEIKRLVSACDGPYGPRDAAMILTLYDTGLRASELTSALLESFSDQPPGLRVYGKGRKWRTVPMGRNTARAIRRYLRTREVESPALFASRAGRPLTPNGLLQVLRRRGEQAGIECHPHQFRHTFAVTYLRNGGDLMSLQRILGHTSLDMVRHYARLADSDVAEMYGAYSPADRL